MTPHAFTPRTDAARACMRCPFPSAHPIHTREGGDAATVAQGVMSLSIEPSGAATVVAPDGRRYSGVLYPR